MKRLVLLGEGPGDEAALPVLVRKLLREKDSGGEFFVDQDVIHGSNPVRWDRETARPDYTKWISRVTHACRRANLGGVLAVYDGDAPTFPAGSASPFCAGNAAKLMARAAAEAGAGKTFSLAVVFARVEYESWIIAGVESLAGKRYEDGRLALPPDVKFPTGDPESHGKRWLEQNCRTYRPSRDQSALTELLDLGVVRAKGLRSFKRLEHAIDQLLDAAGRGAHISTPT
jgi:hypothetical protein